MALVRAMVMVKVSMSMAVGEEEEEEGVKVAESMAEVALDLVAGSVMVQIVKEM